MDELKRWRVPFICYYAVYILISPEDGCAEIRGEVIVHAEFKEEAIQKVECRLSRLGFNRVFIYQEAVEEV